MTTDTTKFRKSIVARALLTAFCGTATMLVVTDVAAQAPSTGLQRVEITGSNIRRAETETASPIQTVTRDDIQKSGKSSVAEYLQTLAADNSGSVPMTFGNGFAAGASGLSLRGLGAAATLVLVNGRRVAPYGADDHQKEFVDLNMIPLEAVERVEILKDGASAIYGSDAIAGVVNIILRKSYVGTAAQASFGQSRNGDGTEKRASISHGFGDLDAQGFNILLNFEVSDKKAIYYADRTGRGVVGRLDLRRDGLGLDATTATGNGGNGGTGAILGKNSAGPSVTGNVRNPTTLNYYNRANPAGVGFTQTFQGANCATASGNYPQGDPGGGCLIDAQNRYGQVQPDERHYNFFGRGVKQLNGTTQLYAELNAVRNESKSQTTPTSLSTSWGSAKGAVTNSSVSLGAAHPDNPYFGTAARLRYLPTDLGPRISEPTSNFVRILAGVKGTYDAWEYDSAFLFSESKTNTAWTHYVQKDVLNALLNPTAANVAAATARSPAYAALPPGTFYRIAENAGLNSAAVYGALSPGLQSQSLNRTTMVDFKATREFGQLPGGPIGVALGAELRRESQSNVPTTGTREGQTVGLSYTEFAGSRTIGAVFAEGLFPVSKMLEASAALRVDRYSDVGTSVTPKVGMKWTPAKAFALRGTYAEGFRAPSAPENGIGGASAFSTVPTDPVRCPLGVPGACGSQSVALITAANPDLKPEKSKSYSLGMVWDVTSKSNVALDFWQIVRSNEINTESSGAAVAAGRVTRDATGSTKAGDPGPITGVFANYINSAKTTVRGVDLDAKHRFDLGSGKGNVTLSANWTHLFSFLRDDGTGTQLQYAGTHGNCDATNCMGTPKDRVNLGVSWDVERWRFAALANYRGKIDNVEFKGAPCSSSDVNGNDLPNGCRIASFTTVDVTARWRMNDKTEIFGGIRNVFDRIPPFDPTTYGALNYNPLDYSGAVGRFFSVGLRHKF